jgi:hypothetical protein
MALTAGLPEKTTAKDIEEGLRNFDRIVVEWAKQHKALSDSIQETNIGADRRIAEIDSKLRLSLATGEEKISDIQNQATGFRPTSELRSQRIEAHGQMEFSAAKDEFVAAAEEAAKIKDEMTRGREAARITADYRVQERQIQAKITEDLQHAREETAQELASQSEKLSSGFAGGVEGMVKGLLVRVPGQHESHGTLIEQLGRNMATEMSGTVLKNMTQMFLFKPDGTTGMLDKMLPNMKGTALAPYVKDTVLNRIGANDPAVGAVQLAQTKNTDATAANTIATKELTQAFEYIASGGTTGSLPGGATLPASTPGIAAADSIQSALPALAAISSAAIRQGAAAQAVLLPDILRTTGGVGNMGSIPDLPSYGTSGDLSPVFDAITGGGNTPDVNSTISYPSIEGDAAAASEIAAPSAEMRSTISFPEVGGNAYSDAGAQIGVPDVAGQAGGTPASELPFTSAAQTAGDVSTAMKDVTAVVGFASKVSNIVGAATGGIGKFTSLMANPFADQGGTPGVDGEPGKDLGRFSPMGIAAAGADIAIGGITAYQQFKRGGAKGALGGTSAILGTAAALDPEPISKMALGLTAAVTGLVSSILGDPKQIRQRQIENTLYNNQYQAPQAISISSTTRGGYSDVDSMGNIRSSSFSPYPFQVQAYKDVPYRFDVPGVTTGQFGNGPAPAGPAVIVNHNYGPGAIQTIDHSGFAGLLKRASADVADAAATGLESGPTRLHQALRRASGNA